MMSIRIGLAIFTILTVVAPCASAAELWTPAELAGRPEERRSGGLHPPDLTAPARTVPSVQQSALPAPLRGSIRRVDTKGEKLVALTFDLCELSDQKAGYDGAVVDILRSEGVAATFFASGKWLRSHPERAMQLAADPLFEIGNHAWTHGNFGVLDAARMREQLAWTQAQYELVREDLIRLAAERGVAGLEARVPASIRVFRFPYGRCRPEALNMLADMGLAAVQWDVNTMDASKSRTGAENAATVEKGVRPGSIVLGHANGNGHGTAESLRIIIPSLRAKGYRFVTVSRLLESGAAQTSLECYDSRPGDTAVYDSIFGDGTVHPRPKQ